MSSPAALSCRDVSVTIDDNPLLRTISLDVGVGEWVSIIGPNGAGKSTLLRAITGVQQHDGTVDLAGVSVAAMTSRERARAMAWVPQQPIIPPGMRVIDYVLLGRTPHMGPLGRESSSDVAIVVDLLADLDLAELGDRMLTTLSGGERQRVLIARALAQHAPLLLLDEPTTALDIGHQQDVLELLEQLRRDGDRSLVTTMHDLTLAGQYADRLVFIAGGEIVAEGTAADVLTEENLRLHYGADVRITRDEDGTLVVLPRRRTTISPSTP